MDNEKSKSNHVMVDLETMGINSRAAIIAIGAVRFNIFGITDRFYNVVTLDSSMKAGLQLDASTILWWLQQSDKARAEFKNPGTHIEQALRNFVGWIGKKPVMWGNGAAFDNVILSNAYGAVGVNVPWDFWNDRCYRTIKALYPGIRADEFKGEKHNAVNDAEHQAMHLIKIIKEGGGKL